MSDPRWTIYEQHSAALRRFVRRRVEADAVEDVLADTFAIAWRRLPQELEHEPLPWLYTVASRAVLTHLRSTRRRTRLVTRVIAHHDRRHAPEPAELIVDDPSLARAFATLKDPDREALCLVAWEGLSNDEAARAAGCSTATFAVRYSRARTRLGAALELERAAHRQPEGHVHRSPCPQTDPV